MPRKNRIIHFKKTYAQKKAPTRSLFLVYSFKKNT